jgi:hypothetical protein
VSDTKPGIQRLEDLLGFLKNISSSMKEIKDMLSKAIDLHRSVTVADREWKSKVEKFNKEYGKVLNKLESFGQGQKEESEQKVEVGVLSQEQ